MLEFKTVEPKMPVLASEMTLIDAFNLTPMEARFLQALLRGGWIGAEEFPEAAKSMRQVILLMRKQLERPYGITIINNGAGRYAIPPIAKERARRALERLAQKAAPQKVTLGG